MMQRFDYVSYVTPDDPKQLRQQNQGRFRTAAATFREVAEAFAGDDRDTVKGELDKHLVDDPSQNQFQFRYRAALSEVHIEMQEVAEGLTHPLSREGFVAWAENRVRSNSAFEGSPNTVELELAGALHQVQEERLHDLGGSDLRAWLADILWVGHVGLGDKSREELLDEIDAEIIQLAEDEFDTVEDALE